MLEAKILNLDILLDSFDTSIIEYECPKYEQIHIAESDCGIIECECGVELDCNLLNIIGGSYDF